MLKGLSSEEARERLAKYGKNVFAEEKKRSAFGIFLEQFEEPIVIIFILSGIFSGFLGEFLDAAVIFAITFFVVLLGFFQEYKAERALEALKKIIEDEAKVIRDGKVKLVPVEEIVPGDLVILEAGDKIPADGVLVEGSELLVDEAVLTGESYPVEKKINDKLFAGTLVVKGRGLLRVEKTGKETKFGEIAKMVAKEKEATGLQKKMEHLAKQITNWILIALALTALIGFLRKESLVNIITVSIATAIAGIPESLPLTSTITLAIGVYEMAKRKAIVRKMRAIEELGLVTVIATDKTGTLTKNEMTLKEIWVNGKLFEVSGVGYEATGDFYLNGEKVDVTEHKDLSNLLISAVLCSDAKLVRKAGAWQVAGDPLEAAIIVALRKLGISEELVRQKFPRTFEIPFSSERKMMLTRHMLGGEEVEIIKGAPEVVLELCENKLGAEEAFHYMARKGLRVLAVAARRRGSEKFTLLGLLGFLDPPREGVKEAIEVAKKAGIRVVMITGDNPETASAIAKLIGIEGEVITGEELEKLSEKELLEKVKKAGVFARVEPKHKLKIVKLLRKEGEIVAVTGDGVNDAPALKEADVGIAMGIKGTDVAKEVSDIILADDNFKTIVDAIYFGRNIYENIRKFTSFLITWNIGVTLLILLGALFFGFDLPVMLPLQILLLNVVLEDLPAIALGLEPPSKEVMLRPPRDPKEPFLTRRMWAMIAFMGIYIALLSFGVFLKYRASIELARTMTFLTITFLVMINTLNFRSLYESFIKSAFRPNRLLFGAIAVSLAISAAAIYLGKHVFKFVPISFSYWLLAFLLSLSIIPIGDFLKRVVMR